MAHPADPEPDYPDPPPEPPVEPADPPVEEPSRAPPKTGLHGARRRVGLIFH